MPVTISERPNLTQPGGRIRPRDIIALVAAACDLDPAVITGQRRDRPAVLARHMAMAAVRAWRPDLSLPQIGRAFGNRDHTTIIAALRSFADRRAHDPDLDAAAEDLNQRIADRVETLRGRLTGELREAVAEFDGVIQRLQVTLARCRDVRDQIVHGQDQLGDAARRLHRLLNAERLQLSPEELRGGNVPGVRPSPTPAVTVQVLQ